MKRLIYIPLLIFCSTAFAQEKILPRQLSDEERHLLIEKGYDAPEVGGITSPPDGPVRAMAEWEEIQTLVITWTGFPSIHAQIIDAAQEECEVLITCSDSNQVKNYLTAQGIPLHNLSFLNVPYNSIWIRDYAGHTVYKNEVDSVYLVEWIYNRPRPYDDVMPESQAAFKNIPLYSTTTAPDDLVNTGGNWMTDGAGIGFASKLILEENDSGNPYGVTVKSPADVDSIMKRFMGLQRFITMETLPFDLIHHIDMHMKLLDEETILVGEFPPGVADGPQVEANIEYVLSNFNSVYGTPYKVIRIPMPPSANGQFVDQGAHYRTYTNSVFVNKKVLVPTYREEYDTTALRIYAEALPGYDIVPIDCDNPGAAIIGLSGAIHCITNAIGADGQLLIRHQKLENTHNSSSAYPVSATIKHRSGIASATLWWSITPGSGYATVAMTSSGNDTWTANIPPQPAGTTVYYYIEANAVSGKIQTRPMVAPAGYFSFEVENISSAGNHPPGVINKIYPNPANAITCVEFEMAVAGEFQVVMRDVMGRVVEVLEDGYLPPGFHRAFVMAHEYPSGTYFIELKTAAGRNALKLLINN